MADDRTKGMKAAKVAPDEPNALAAAATDFVQRAKTGRLLSPTAARLLGLALVAVLGIGVWAYLSRASQKAASRTWADLSQPGVDLADYAARNQDSAAGRVARLEQARLLAGPQGIATLGSSDRETRNKGVENLTQARDDLARLAGEFGGDPVLAAATFSEAAEAELALVGIRKGADAADSLGTVAQAAEYLKKAAAAVGPATPAGEKFSARAADLETKAEQILSVGQELHMRFYAPPTATALTPAQPAAPVTTGAGILAPPTPPAAVDLPGTPATKR